MTRLSICADLRQADVWFAQDGCSGSEWESRAPIIAAGIIEALVVALKAHEQFMGVGRKICERAILPAVDSNAIERDVFIGRMLEHFDGQKQRYVQSLAGKALAFAELASE